MDVETDETESESSFGLTAVEVHAAIYYDRFREACSHGDVEAMSSILENRTQKDQLELIHKASYPLGPVIFESIASNQLYAMEFLIERGYNLEEEYDVDMNNPILFKDKCTALCFACACGEVEPVMILLKHKADVNHVSLNASPIIYASQYNNVEMISLLLGLGADVNLLPASFNSQTVFLPLFQACLNGHGDTAELFLEKVKDKIGVERKICYLGLLGAQCINNFEDYDKGLLFWKIALNSLAELCQSESNSSNNNIKSNDQEMTQRLKTFYAEGSKHAAITQNVILHAKHKPKLIDKVNSFNESNYNSPLYESVFGDMQLCSTLEELETLSNDKKRLTLQALLVLQDILGPSHPETIAYMYKAAEKVMELGDLEFACKLLLYGVESNEKCGRTEEASIYSSQLADYLLKSKYSNTEQLNNIENFSSLKHVIFAALELVIKGMVKIQKSLFPQDLNPNEEAHFKHSFPNLTYTKAQVKCMSKIKLFTEMVETFMALLRILVDILPGRTIHCNGEDGHIVDELQRSVSSLIFLCHKTTSPYSKFSLESEIMKIAVCGDHSALSTLYFYQEELFPNLPVLEFLMICGTSTNCVDFQGDTPLHHSIDCDNPNREVVLTLLDYGADIDVRNRQGITPYRLLSNCPKLNINPFNYLSLKCLAATAVVKYHIPCDGELPKLVESFVMMHRMPKINLIFGKC